MTHRYKQGLEFTAKVRCTVKNKFTDGYGYEYHEVRVQFPNGPAMRINMYETTIDSLLKREQHETSAKNQTIPLEEDHPSAPQGDQGAPGAPVDRIDEDPFWERQKVREWREDLERMMPPDRERDIERRFARIESMLADMEKAVDRVITRME